MDLEVAWKDKNFEVIWTEDGSPSLKPLMNPEMMHHRGGALAETQFIYGEAVREVMGLRGTSFLSVGLGLAYNELVIADEALENRLPSARIRSFETESVLKEEFLDYVHTGKVTRPTQEIYALILKRLKHGDQILGWLRRMYQQGMWTLEGALGDEAEFPDRAQAILFDAFSSKATPALWTEEFFADFLKKAAANDLCIFSTYACTGTLKRSLKAAGFEVVLRKGFHGKRNSTLGRRSAL